MWHLPMSARRQYMSTMRSEAAGSTQMYRPSSPRRLKLGIPNGDSSLLASHTYMIYMYLCCVQNMPSWSKLQFWKTWITPALPHPNWAEKKLKTMSLFDLFQSEFIRFHTMNSTISSIRTLLEQFCVTSGANHKRFTFSFYQPRGIRGGTHFASPSHTRYSWDAFQLQTYPYRLRIFSLL